MARVINIGFGNVVNTDKILAVLNPDSAPAKRLIQRAKEQEVILDGTQGRRTKAILVADNGMIILSALLPDTITARINVDNNGEQK